MLRTRIVALVTIAALLVPMTALCLTSVPADQGRMACCSPPGPNEPPVARPCCGPAGEQPNAPVSNTARPIDAAAVIAIPAWFGSPAPSESIAPSYSVHPQAAIGRLSTVLLI